jgi:hypothetical protein
MCRLSKNLGASTSWSPKGLYRPVMGLLYLFMSAIWERKILRNIIGPVKKNDRWRSRINAEPRDQTLSRKLR